MKLVWFVYSEFLVIWHLVILSDPFVCLGNFFILHFFLEGIDFFNDKQKGLNYQ